LKILSRKTFDFH